MDIIETAKKVIDREIEGLRSLIDKSFDENFEKAIASILNIKGRVIVSGMGKSGHIARKMAATFSSTGTPSQFVHPGEASHGDLGMITPNDIVIYLSESGNTKEMDDILHHCKRNGIKIIGITRVADSMLIKYCDIPIVLERIPETNEFNAPTTSTTMMMAFGDALATTLLTINKFDHQKYRHLHPGGKLGASLIQVQDIMRPLTDVPTCTMDDYIFNAADNISQKIIGCTAVVDQNNYLLGIITEGDILRNLKNISHNTFVHELANTNPIVVQQDTLAAEAVHLMNISGRKGINVILVVDDKLKMQTKQAKLVGVLHIQDCIKANVA